MIKKEQKIEMAWNPSNIKHFKNKGYPFTKFGDTFKVNVEDLTEGSNKDILIVCDYCNNNTFPRPYYSHLTIRRMSQNQKDHCEDCRGEKAKEISRNRIVSWDEVIALFKERQYIVVTKETDYENGNTQIEYICEKHPELGSQFNTFHQLNYVEKRESGYEYIRGCRGCNMQKFKEDLKINPSKYYLDRDLYKIDIVECKRRFEEFEGIRFVEGQVYEGDKKKYKFTCQFHPEEGVQWKRLNDLLYSKYACRGCWREGISKENCHLWKGGKSNEAALLRRSPEYKDWRNQVFKNDDYMCIACGDISGGNLIPHHVENFAEHPEKRFLVENGVTLCEKHHDLAIKGSFHNIYGTTNNNREQLNEYLDLTHKELGIDWSQITAIKERVKRERAMNPYKRPASTKLTDVQVYEIIGRLVSTDDSYSVIAKDYGVSQGRIYDIAKGKAFKDITKGRVIR